MQKGALPLFTGQVRPDGRPITPLLHVVLHLSVSHKGFKYVISITQRSGIVNLKSTLYALFFFAVFLAEPVSDILAAAVTTFMFFRFFLKLMKNKPAVQ